ncbi:MAG: RND family efflux transporter MFP subunit [Planctomycetota bacterium]|jgi:RND family efflux transporter MFP subunit
MVVQKVLQGQKQKKESAKKVAGKSARTFPLKTLLWGVGGVVILALLLSGLTKAHQGERELYTVARGDIVREVVLSGKVEPVRDADLGFVVSGQAQDVFVTVGQKVQKGDPLVVLDSSSVVAQLSSTSAEIVSLQATYQDTLRGSRQEETDIILTQVENAARDIALITSQQNILVNNAYRALLNTTFEAVADDPSDSQVPPVVSGTYLDEEEGEYTITVYGSSTDSGYSFRYTGIESGTTTVTTGNPSPLGSRGLRVQFPETSGYSNTIWHIPVPNVNNANYQTNLNIYQAALETRGLSIAQAENILAEKKANLQLDKAGSTKESIGAAAANIDVARARSQEIEAELRRYTLEAPFDGVITDIELEVGEIVSAQTVVVSLISDGLYEVVISVPEIDIPRIRLGALVEVTLDAYRNDVLFPARVARINPSDSTIDGVSVYETTLEFLDTDERIIAGMTANARVAIDERRGVISIPKYLITTDGTEKYVTVQVGDEIVERVIVTGLEGSNGMTEVVSGLVPGDAIVLPEEDTS